MIINVLDEVHLPVSLNTLSTQFKQGRMERPIGCDFHQILFVVSGEGVLNYKNKEYRLKKGNAFFTLDSTPVCYNSTDSLTVAFLTVKGDGVKKLADYYKIKGFLFYEKADIKKYLLDLSYIKEEFFSFKREGKLSSMCYSFFINFFEENFKPNTEIDTVKMYIAKNFTKKITLEEIALNCGISVSKLCHDFKKNFNKTIFRYILDLRLTYAKNLFRTDMNAKTKDVAQSSGFNDISYFCKAYKAKFKVSPSADKIRTSRKSKS